MPLGGFLFSPSAAAPHGEGRIVRGGFPVSVTLLQLRKKLLGLTPSIGLGFTLYLR